MWNNTIYWLSQLASGIIMLVAYCLVPFIFVLVLAHNITVDVMDRLYRSEQIDKW